MNRRDAFRDADETLRQQAWYLAPARYEQLFLADQLAGSAYPDETEEEMEEVVDLDLIDSYFDDLEETKSMTGAQLFALADHEGWM